MMINQLFHSVQSEWIKKKRSAASWLVLLGGLFIPSIMLLINLYTREKLSAKVKLPNFWETSFGNAWESMAFFLLPMGIILATSLIAQLEYKNNTWKQLHTTPQSYLNIFIAKYIVVLIMLLQFFLIFNLGIYLAGVLPSLVYASIDYPMQSFPWSYFLYQNALFFVTCLPIFAIQYLISLNFKNFLLSIGIGLVLVVAAMFAISWKYGYAVPFTYSAINYLMLTKGFKVPNADINIHWMATGYFVLFSIVNYLIYANKKSKG